MVAPATIVVIVLRSLECSSFTVLSREADTRVEPPELFEKKEIKTEILMKNVMRRCESPETQRSYRGKMHLFACDALLAHRIPKSNSAVDAAAPKGAMRGYSTAVYRQSERIE